jgi:nitroreductase
VTAYDLILSRRSVYEFEPLPVERALLERCIEAAIWAPNRALTQPWRFVVLQGQALQRAAAAVAAAEAGTGEDAGAVARAGGRLGHSGGSALRTSAAAVAVLQRQAADPDVRADDRLAVAAAVENLILCAWDEGLGTLWVGGPAARDPGVRAVVGAAEDEELVALVALGYPAAVPPRRPRKKAAELTTWLS